jgi:hypothetical protein
MPSSSVNSSALPDYDIAQARISDYTFGEVTVPVSMGTQYTEPSVVYEPLGWNGYPYWMVIAPFDGSNPATENPEVFVSQNGTTWTVPPGGSNPLVPAPSGAPSNYNSDPYMTFNEDRSQLIIIYREVFESNCNLKLISSSNGVTWSSPVTMLSTVRVAEDLLQASIVYNQVTKVWTMYACDDVKAGNQLVYCTATTPTGPWSSRTNCSYSLPPGETSVWHGNLKLLSSGVVVGLMLCGGSGGGHIYPLRSTDGVTFTFGPRLVTRLSGANGCGYQSAFVPIGSKWAVYMGFILHPAWKMEYGWVSFDEDAYRTARNSFLASCCAPTLPTIGGVITWDSFDRPDSAVSLDSPTTGTSWTADGGTLGISSNKAYAPGSGNNKAYIASGVSDIDLRVEFPTAPTNSGAYLTWRGTDTNNFFRLQIQSGVLVVQGITGGGIVNSWTRVWTVAANDEVRVIAKGNSNRIYVNGTLLVSFSSGTRNTGTRHGIQITNTTDTLNNFLLTEA